MAERYGSGTEEYKFKRAKAKILQTQEVCGICGRPVDKGLKYPHPLSATVDHIIPLAKGGTNDAGNLQLAHWCCNRQKSDKMEIENRVGDGSKGKRKVLNNRVLPQTMDWSNYKA